MIKHGVGIRDFAFEDWPEEPEAEVEFEVEVKEEGEEEHEFSRGRSDSTASPPKPGILQLDSFCSLTPEQQQLVLDAWESGDAIPSEIEQQKAFCKWKIAKLEDTKASRDEES